MNGNLRLATDAEIERLLDEAREIERLIYGPAASDHERLDLEKAWHAIHFVLTGTRLGGDAPLNFLVSVDTPVGDVDVGFGPARVLRSQQVQQLAAALAGVPPGEFAQRVDLRRLDEMAIYPGGWQ